MQVLGCCLMKVLYSKRTSVSECFSVSSPPALVAHLHTEKSYPIPSDGITLLKYTLSFAAPVIQREGCGRVFSMGGWTKYCRRWELGVISWLKMQRLVLKKTLWTCWPLSADIQVSVPCKEAHCLCEVLGSVCLQESESVCSAHGWSSIAGCWESWWFKKGRVEAGIRVNGMEHILV